MSGFAIHSFCDGCGTHRLEMPFGQSIDFWDCNRGPCRQCGEPGPGHRHTCRRMGFWQTRYIDRDGQRVDVPANELAKDCHDQ